MIGFASSITDGEHPGERTRRRGADRGSRVLA